MEKFGAVIDLLRLDKKNTTKCISIYGITVISSIGKKQLSKLLTSLPRRNFFDWCIDTVLQINFWSIDKPKTYIRTFNWFMIVFSHRNGFDKNRVLIEIKKCYRG